MVLTDVATAANAAAIRRSVRAWLGERGIGEARICDVVLGVYEALANCVEHAYGGSTAGSMTLTADHDPTTGSVTVRVSDQGQWRPPVPPGFRNPRSRGLALMNRVAQHCTVSAGPEGTTVCLQYTLDNAGDALGSGVP